MHCNEVIFTFYPNLEPFTSYLITKLPLNQTLKYMVFGMAYDCKIRNKNWVRTPNYN